MNWLSKLSELIDLAIEFLGIYGPIFGCFIIVIESIIPIIPLCVFITLNFLTFGNIIGFIISWIFTIIGCMISFIIFKKGIRRWFTEKLRLNEFVNKFMNIIDDLKFNQLVVLLAIPFAPAFAINIAAGLSKITTKKYLMALLIGKIFMVYFWGFIGTSLIQSLTDPIILLKVVIACLLAYVVGLLLNKHLKLD